MNAQSILTYFAVGFVMAILVYLAFIGNTPKAEATYQHQEIKTYCENANTDTIEYCVDKESVHKCRAYTTINCSDYK